jgi:alpha-D-xyloside xylohydrolase
VTFSAKSFTPALLATTLLSAASAHAAEGRFERTPDGVIVAPASGPAHRVRLQVMGDRLIHVTAIPGERFELPPSLQVTAKPVGGGFTVVRKGEEVVLSTGAVSAEVSLATGQVLFRDRSGKVVLAETGRAPFTPVKVEGQDFYSVRQEFNSGTTEGFYGLGQHQNGQMNYNGEDVELSQYNRNIAIPFVLSTRNYGVLWDNNAISRFGNPIPYDLASRDLKIYDASGRPGGFTASYYVGDQLKLTRVEPDINYQFLRDQPRFPAEMKDQKDQRVVWEGQVEPTVSGVQKFKIYSSDYVKVWVDGKLRIDRWRQNWNPWYHNFDVPMQAGVRHTIRVDWRPEGGYIALVHDNPMPAADRHSLYLTSDVARAIDYYFIGGDSFDQVISGYRKLTGPAVLLPQWAYGFWQSRQRYETQAQLLGVLDEYRKLGLPLDNIVQDWLYWPENAWGSHKFDPARYPDPKAMIDEIHSLHAHLMVSIWAKFYPTTDNFKELDAAGHMYHRNIEQGAKDWVGPGYLNSFYDPYSKQARDIYWRQVRDNLKVLGVDAWWMDSDEPDMHSNLDIPERTLRMSPTALGPGGAFFNSYPLIHTEGVFEGERAYAPDKRSFILSRSGFGGIQRNGVAVWSGDVVARWDDLRDQISAGVNLSMSGIPNWTFDIGGFSVEHRYEHPDAAALDEWRELNLRWFQFGAFAPLFRSHGEAPYREIYNLAPVGSDLYNALADYDRLRYRLMPYTYTLAGDTYQRDGTIMRGLVMDFPNDPKVWDINDQYMFGPAFLVSPVHAYKARSRPVYLPAGTGWYDFYTGQAYAGGREIEAQAPLNRMPLFVKAGSIVPTGPDVQWVGQKPDAPVMLFVYTGANGSFELYEDDGLSNSYARGAFSQIPIRWDERTRTLSLGARRGSFQGMRANRTFNIRWISGPRPDAADFSARPDQSVAYDGRPVSVRRGG